MEADPGFAGSWENPQHGQVAQRWGQPQDLIAAQVELGQRAVRVVEAVAQVRELVARCAQNS